jgi:hypothetical protein
MEVSCQFQASAGNVMIVKCIMEPSQTRFYLDLKEDHSSPKKK